MEASDRTIVLIHGLWMTPRSWEQWVAYYSARGYNVLAPAYPGLEVEVEALRADPAPIEALTVPAVVEHYAEIVRGLDRPPILMGHSFGGVLVQILLDRGLGAAGVAIDSVPAEGILVTPVSQIRASFPVLRNPANRHRAVPLTPEQFHYAFTNTLSAEESLAVYERYHIPAPGGFVWGGVLANFTPGHQDTYVDFENDDRAPLLFIAGGEDNIMPPAVNQANAKHYRRSKAVTEYKEFPGRSHYTLGQEGWEAVADYALSWASAAASGASATPVAPATQANPAIPGGAAAALPTEVIHAAAKQEDSMTSAAAGSESTTPGTATPSAVSAATSDGGARPTVVLVHGAFADAAGWDGVIRRLQGAGYEVLAPANPLRGLAADAAYVGSILDTLPGPVVLVGHSYGGAVITNAARGKANVKALVYIAAVAPDEGDSLGSLVSRFPGSRLVPPGLPGATLIARPYPLPGGGTGADGYIDPALFPQLFAADLPAPAAASMGAAQRPAEVSTLQEPSGAPAWKDIPSWALVAGADHVLGTDNVRAMAQRAGAQIVEVEGASHAVMISRPEAVVDLIGAAVASLPTEPPAVRRLSGTAGAGAS